MAGIAATLVESTENRLRYQLIDDGSSGSFPSTLTIDNATLQADAIGGSQLADLLATAVADQAAARQLLCGEGLTADSDIDTARAHLKLTPKNIVTTQTPWAADANVAANLAVVDIYGPDAAGAIAFLDVEFAHTLTR
jgi:hypothetical protein